MGAVIEWDWLDRKYCDGEIRGEDGSWRSLFALLRAGVLLLLLLRSRMRSRHLARPRDPLTLALATTCSQSLSPCAITFANTANTATTATTTTPPHSLRSIYSHHRRRAPSILEPRFAYPTSVFARLANPVCSTSKNTFMASHDSPSDDTAVTQNDRIKFRFCREWYNRPIAHPTRRTADSLRQLQHALPS